MSLLGIVLLIAAWQGHWIAVSVIIGAAVVAEAF